MKINTLKGIVFAGLLLISSSVFADNQTVYDNVIKITVSADHPDFDIVLPINPSTGYHYNIADWQNSALVLASSEPEYLPPNTNVLGTPGRNLWHFHVDKTAFTSPQTIEVSFTYVQPGDDGYREQPIIFQVTTIAANNWFGGA